MFGRLQRYVATVKSDIQREMDASEISKVKQEVTEAARFPQVELKGLCDSCALPATFPTTVDKTLKAELTFHGIKKELEVPVKLTYESATRIHAVAHLSVSLDAFKIERPSLLFAKVDDEIGRAHV